jgi:hypothetical protein
MEKVFPDCGAAPGDAYAACDVETVRAEVDWLAAKGGSHCLGALYAKTSFDVTKDDKELLSAIAADGVCIAYRSLKTLRGAPEDLIAGEVAEGVVDLLEVVEVDERDAEGRVVFVCVLHLGGEGSHDGVAVEQPCE